MTATTEAAERIRISAVAPFRPALAEFVGSAGLMAESSHPRFAVRSARQV